MTRAALALLFAGCGRIAFDPTSGDDAIPVDPSLRLWLAFEDDLVDGGDDSSGYTAGATCFSSCPLTSVSGRHGNAARFDGNATALQVDLVTALPFTWSVWVRLGQIQSFSALMSQNGANTSPGGAELVLFDGGYSVWSNSTRVDSGDSVAVGAWTHLAFVRTTTSIIQLVDGVVVNSSSDPLANDFGGCPILIGVDADTGCVGGLNGYLEGDLDELRVYARALSTAEVAADMASPTPLPP